MEEKTATVALFKFQNKAVYIYIYILVAVAEIEDVRQCMFTL